MWRNDTHGDCVTAEEAIAKACHSQEIFITDNEVQKWATAHGWYDGATLIEVLKAMQTGGFKQGGHTLRHARTILFSQLDRCAYFAKCNISRASQNWGYGRPA